MRPKDSPKHSRPNLHLNYTSHFKQRVPLLPSPIIPLPSSQTPQIFRNGDFQRNNRFRIGQELELIPSKRSRESHVGNDEFVSGNQSSLAGRWVMRSWRRGRRKEESTCEG